MCKLGSALACTKITNYIHDFWFTSHNAKRATLRDCSFAEREGFEPPVPLSTPVFKTGVFDHSTISPSVLENWLWSESGCKGNAFFRHYQIFPLLFFDIAEYLFCREFKHAAGVVFFQRDVEAGLHQKLAADDFAVKIAGLIVYLHVDFPDAIVL